MTAGRQALWTLLSRLQVSLCLATILLLTCSHFHLQWPFLTSWMASLVEMRPGCNIINQTPCCPSPILTTYKLLGTWGRQPCSGATGGGSRWQKPDNCKISVEQINTMVLRVTAARQALWTLLPRSQVLFCPASISLQTLWPFFKSWMARLVNSLQRCNGAYLSGVTISAASKTTTRTMPSSPPCD